MSANQAFFGAPSRNDWMMLSQLTAALGKNDLTTFSAMLAAYTTPVGTVKPVTGVGPGAYGVAWPGNLVWIVIGDPDPDITWAQAGLAGPLVPAWAGPGNLLPAIENLGPAVAAQAISKFATSPAFVVLGHGQGGAVAQAVAAFLVAKGQNLQGCYVMGAPNIGDAAFVAPLSGSTYSLAAPLDPIAALDPTTATTLTGLPPAWASLTSLPACNVAASQQRLLATGAINDGFTPLTAPVAVQQLITGSAGDNALAVYLTRLKRGATGLDNQTAGAGGYASPWILYGLASPASGGGLLPFGRLQTQSTQQQLATQTCIAQCDPLNSLMYSIGAGT